MSKIYANLDDLSSSSNAEILFKESIELCEANTEESSKQLLKYKEELVKFYLKQDRYEVILPI